MNYILILFLTGYVISCIIAYGLIYNDWVKYFSRYDFCEQDTFDQGRRVSIICSMMGYASLICGFIICTIGSTWGFQYRRYVKR